MIEIITSTKPLNIRYEDYLIYELRINSTLIVWLFKSHFCTHPCIPVCIIPLVVVALHVLYSIHINSTVLNFAMSLTTVSLDVYQQLRPHWPWVPICDWICQL